MEILLEAELDIGDDFDVEGGAPGPKGGGSESKIFWMAATEDRVPYWIKRGAMTCLRFNSVAAMKCWR